MQRLKGRLGAAIAVTVWSGALILVWSPPAFAVCTFDKNNVHTVGGIDHGWSRTYCQSTADYVFTVHTDHGHGQKYVALCILGLRIFTVTTSKAVPQMRLVQSPV